MNKSCKFCKAKVAEIKQFQADEILYESDKYYAISSIGGFIPGWTLVFPKEHNLNLSGMYCHEELIAFISEVNNVVSELYGPTVVFEHGSNNEESQTACGVAHAHIHIVPFGQDIESLAKESAPNLPWEKTNLITLNNIVKDNEYFFCSSNYKGHETEGYVAISDTPQSQFFRKVLAKAVGLVDLYDYKKYRFEEVSADTAKKVSQHFSILEKN